MCCETWMFSISLDKWAQNVTWWPAPNRRPNRPSVIANIPSPRAGQAMSLAPLEKARQPAIRTRWLLSQWLQCTLMKTPEAGAATQDIYKSWIYMCVRVFMCPQGQETLTSCCKLLPVDCSVFLLWLLCCLCHSTPPPGSSLVSRACSRIRVYVCVYTGGARECCDSYCSSPEQTTLST